MEEEAGLRIEGG